MQIGKVPMKNVQIMRESQNHYSAPKHLEKIMPKEGKTILG